MRFMLTLQGETSDNNILLESWEISEAVYLHMRAHMDREPLATTLTDPSAKVLSQRFAGDDDAQD